MLEGRQAKKIPYGPEGRNMSILKFCFVFAALVMVLAPAYASEENALHIENMTSISSIVNPATLNLARSVNAAPEWRNFIPPQAFWSPDGSKLLIRSSIGWYKDDINFRPSNRNGIDAIYTLDADGTNLTKIVSNEINNRSTPIGLSAPLGNNPWSPFNPWSPLGDKIAIGISVPRTEGFYLLANPNEDRLNALGTNFSGIISIITNLSKFSWQKDFMWSPDGTKAVFVVTDIEKSERKYIVKSEKLYVADADGSNIKQLASDVNESFLGAVTWSHNGKRIAFSGKNLWIVNSDGTTLRQFGDCWGGTWSPDGSKIAFSSSTAKGEHVFIANPDGTERVQITTGESKRYTLSGLGGSWSPDGSRLLIESRNGQTSRNEVLIAKLSGYDRTMPIRASENINLGEVATPQQTVDATQEPAATADALKTPGFSMIFAGIITDIVKPHTVNDSKEVSLKPGRYFMEPVQWSPDGGRILIRSMVGWSQSEEINEVYVLNADGTGLAKIVSSRFLKSKGARIANPTWIEGGDKIAFLLNRPNGSRFVVVNPDGTGLRAIGTNLSDIESILAFLPDAGHWQGFYIGDLNKFTTVAADGMNLENILKEDRKANAEKIAFVEQPKYSLYTMNPDGTGKTLLALTGWGEFFERPVAAWNPSGDKIVFSAITEPGTGKQVDFDTFWARKEYYEAHIFLSNPDGTERVQLTSKEPYNVITGGWSPDGSRLIIGSSSDIEMRAWNVSIIKLRGYDEILSIYSLSSIKQGTDVFIEVKSMSKPVENATIFLNGSEIGETNESGFLKYSFKEAGNLKLSAAKQGFRMANKSITVEELPSEQSSPELALTATPQIAKPATLAVTPKAPGFDSVLTISILSTIYLFKRRYN